MNNKMARVEQFLTEEKMKFKKTKKGEDVHFEYRLADGNAIFPALCKLRMGSGETTDQVFGTVARYLGLTEIDLNIAMRCKLRRECILTCAAVHLTCDFLKRVEGDPLVWDQDLQQHFALSIQEMLAEIRNQRKIPWREAEAKALSHARSNLEQVRGCGHTVITECAESILELFER